MVKYNAGHLDRIFGALVDPTRRTILVRLERDGPASVSELAKPFAIKLPAIMKHLDVLEHAGLISRAKQGRTVTVRLQPEPMRQALDWLRRYERFWSERLERLVRNAERAEAQLKRSER
ncbi:MAG TPA: metalloregulator ArsR/SmtB family transcription factor [Steroidobacteraceae bacterium]|nr:metalloregulator ArsR/SmtB family transcription factor [Steroidobacteraceae bacterium]